MMNDMLKEKCDLFLENIQTVRSAFWYENSDIRLCAAMMLTLAGKKADPEGLKEVKKILTGRVGVFSNLRGYAKLPVIMRMYASADPSAYCDDIVRNYGRIKEGRINRTGFDTLAAMILTDISAEQDVNAGDVVDRMNRIYREMHHNHPLLTSREDMPSAMLLALSGKEENEVLGDMEDCYGRLKPDFALRGDHIQTMSAILASFSGIGSDKCNRLEKILHALKDRERSLNHSMYLPVAAGLVTLNGEAGDIADQIKEISDYLNGRSGFKLSGKWKRTAYGAMLLMSADPEHLSAGNAAITSAITNVIISEIIMTLVIISAAASSSAASSSSSN